MSEEGKVVVEGMPATPLPNPEPEDPIQLEKERRIQDKYLGKTVRIKLQDGRVYQGRLDCFDNHANVILDDVSFMAAEGTEPQHPTPLPTPVPVLVAWPHIVSIEVRKESPAEGKEEEKTPPEAEEAKEE